MGRKSIKANKNQYQLSREEENLTRDAASERLHFISSDRIEKIESGKSIPYPEEVLAMADAYKKPSLCNYYCSHECKIGQEYVPEIRVKELSVITLEMISTLNSLVKEKDRLIDIAVDGKISEDEMPDFLEIKKKLDSLSVTIETLKLWVNQAIADGEMQK